MRGLTRAIGLAFLTLAVACNAIDPTQIGDRRGFSDPAGGFAPPTQNTTKHDATLTGNGTTGSPLSVGAGGGGAVSGTSPDLAIFTPDGTHVGNYAGTGTCAAGSFFTALSVAGAKTCAVAVNAAGTGLSLTGSSLAVDPTVEQSRVSGTCVNGTSIRTVAQDGTVSCNTLGAGLTNSGTSIITNLVGGACAVGKVVTNVGADGTTTCGYVNFNDYAGTHLEYSDEFIGLNSPDWLTNTATGTGASNAQVVTTTRPGVNDMQTGTTSTGLVRWNGAGAYLDFGSMATSTWEWVGGWPTLSTVAEEYASVIGFADNATTINQNNGCFFLEDRLPVATAPGTGTITAGSTNLQCWCAAAGVRTGFTMDGVIASQEGFTTVATPVAALTLPNTNILRGRIVVTGTTRAEFYVDSGAGLTKRCDINTNIPSANRTNHIVNIIKSAGTTSRSMYVDRVRLALDLNAVRSP